MAIQRTEAEYAVFSSLIGWMIKGRRLAPHASSERIVTGALDVVRGGNSTSGVSLQGRVETKSRRGPQRKRGL
ncbi:hypothetical protein [Pelosinus baikalensis]|uniref:Uncharacterized protein n=1 Tax=Pelosinus baikalensis TaxID=2892015 RepID=A0ABS8HZJ2_9FIRM|nr:hypothetical protein [Pelosinus baikalensis]MCC5468575.1 hypothetical protein [Pelosinus baikalensis]MCC5468588.1 hypothetical protein [Pelosinus baikalensis]